jgi:hypothetical protein
MGRREARLRLRVGHGRGAPGGRRHRSGAGRRDRDHAHHRHGCAHPDPLPGGDPRLRGRGRPDVQRHGEDDRGPALAAYEGDPRHPPLRQPVRHGADHGARPQPCDSGDRGLRPVLRRDLPREEDRHARRHRDLQPPAGQAHHDRRGRDRRDRRRRPRPPHVPLHQQGLGVRGPEARPLLPRPQLPHERAAGRGGRGAAAQARRSHREAGEPGQAADREDPGPARDRGAVRPRRRRPHLLEVLRDGRPRPDRGRPAGSGQDPQGGRDRLGPPLHPETGLPLRGLREAAHHGQQPLAVHPGPARGRGLRARPLPSGRSGPSSACSSCPGTRSTPRSTWTTSRGPSARRRAGWPRGGRDDRQAEAGPRRSRGDLADPRSGNAPRRVRRDRGRRGRPSRGRQGDRRQPRGPELLFPRGAGPGFRPRRRHHLHAPVEPPGDRDPLPPAGQSRCSARSPSPSTPRARA